MPSTLSVHANPDRPVPQPSGDRQASQVARIASDAGSREAPDLLYARTIANPVGRGTAYLRLMKQSGWTQAELAARLGITKGAVSRILSVVQKLPPDVRKQVASGEINASIAYQLSRLSDAGMIRQLAAKAASGFLTREAAKCKVSQHLGKRVKRTKPIRIALPGGLMIVVPPAMDFEAAKTDLQAALPSLEEAFGIAADSDASQSRREIQP
jgi:transcriptional regulator with XRE-family HTH domain